VSCDGFGETWGPTKSGARRHEQRAALVLVTRPRAATSSAADAAGVNSPATIDHAAPAIRRGKLLARERQAIMETDERAIRDLIASWNAYSQSGDVDRVLELMTDDVVFTVVGRPAFGKREFAESTRQMPGLNLKAHADVLEVVVRGDTAWSRVHLQVDMTSGDGKTQRREGDAMSVYVKHQGRWRLARDANLLGPPR